ncbi:hypothetical protein [Flavivirga rizhaonensis]|uniref:T9SS C-terminal target domain-containing protein n=1 Tax=Flavivirga rizhaonensis TaxID=2559571 RepID=A0A4S1E2U0_9FLAO|nr:hypothetical protein [Flavivirga rizhaonensis]TGV04869.1 hypothetical protein EM932_01740 [Flavivirga rizhaonensis]
MKKIIQIMVFLLLVGSASAQQEKGIIGTDNWLDNWTDFYPKSADYGEPNQILTGNITKDTKLYKKDTYLLMGNVFVTDSTTLTIEPGTVIIGDWESKASLTIAKGATIMAEGLDTDPIVFTSNRSVKKAGDWGGIILLGDAPTNKFGNGSVASMYANLDQSSYGHTNYGGKNIKSNSGVLKYVRIEYAGKRKRGGTNFNGLLLAGVGNETILENIMVSYCAGDSFEVIGGEVNLLKAVSYRSNSNDFKFNLGTQSRLDNSLAIRSPYSTSSNGARCLEITSYDKKEEVDFTKAGTTVIAKNMTMLNLSDDLNAHIGLGLIKEAVFIGENASLDINKSVISGFNPAVILDDKIIINQENLEKIKFVDMFFNNCNGNIFKEYNSNNEDLENWYGNRSFYNVYSKTQNSETFIDLKNKKRPDYRLRINKIIAANGKN